MEQPSLETVTTCALCGGGAYAPFLTITDHTLTKQKFQLTTCDRCGFCWTNPRPPITEIGRYYESSDYISHTNNSQGLQNRIYQQTRRWAIRGKHQLIAAHRTNGKVLDLGCGTGEFLSYLKSRGYITTGVEPNSGAREKAIAQHALEVVPSLDDVPALEQFQIMTLWHVLEHVHDVRTCLKKIHARLSKGGWLMIAVPDRESWDAQHYGAEWAAYDVPRHLSHFRQQDLHRLLKEHGFTLKRTDSMWLDAPYVSMLSEKYRGASATKALFKGAFIGTLSNLFSVFTSRPTSSTLYVAQKT